MLSLRKLFKFPGPSAFREDASDYALPSRDFTPDVDENVYCWEDYYTDLKKAYPIRYFLAETLADFLKYKVWNPLTRPFKDGAYWLKCHLLKEHRYHLVDIRQSAGFEKYYYGWLDTDTRILYASFNLLNEFVKYEFPNLYCPTEEECSSDEHFAASNKRQREAYFEIEALHKWWNVDRQSEHLHLDVLQDRWYSRKYKQKQSDELTQTFWAEYMEAKEKYEAKEEEMLIRLIKVRKSLWT